MSLTKKHFLKIAEIVSRLTYNAGIQASDIDTNIIYTDIIETDKLIFALSDFFKSENANFKADKFKEACYK